MTEHLEPAAVPREWDDLRPLPGRLKDRSEDFRVEEVLGRSAGGHGDWLWVDIEKSGLSMEQLFRALSDALGVHSADIGHAGLKDRVAVTRQTLSLPAWVEERIGTIRPEGVCIHGWERHPGPLHVGQLQGNRFDILLRGDIGDRLEDARAWCRRLESRGAPNAFGMQRFGTDLDTLRMGLAMLREEISVSRMGRMKRRLTLSAVQSHLFNLYLVRRMELGLLRRVIGGDLLQQKGKARHFHPEDLDEAQARYDRGHLRITGPLFGGEGLRARGEAGRLEEEVLTATGLSTQHLARFQTLQRGGRRALVVTPRDMTVDADPCGLRFRFFLPKGAYATEVLAQAMAMPT